MSPDTSRFRCTAFGDPSIRCLELVPVTPKRTMSERQPYGARGGGFGLDAELARKRESQYDHRAEDEARVSGNQSEALQARSNSSPSQTRGTKCRFLCEGAARHPTLELCSINDARCVTKLRCEVPCRSAALGRGRDASDPRCPH